MIFKWAVLMSVGVWISTPAGPSLIAVLRHS